MQMSNKMDCRIIQDLLPSYIDGLTSDYTNQMIEEHISQCESCKQMLQRMQEPENHSNSSEPEINYMKKIRNRMNHLLTTTIVSVLLILLGAVAAIVLYNRIAPKNYQTVFGTAEADWFVATHLSSGSKLTLQDWQVSDLQGMLELTNYYYEGKEENIIEGELFLISVGNSGGPLYEMKITDQNKLYYDGKVYDIRESDHIWDYLYDLLQTDSVWLDYMEDKYSYLNGIYYMETDGSKDHVISFELNLKTRLFSLLPHMYSSYWEWGTFTIDGLTITLDVENAADYVFHITEEGVLSYDAEKSAPLYSVGATVPIPDGTKFIKE